MNVFVSGVDAGSNPGSGGHSSTGPTQAECESSDSSVNGYSELKRKLAEEHTQSPGGYTGGEDAFVKEMDRRATRWRASQAGR